MRRLMRSLLDRVARGRADDGTDAALREAVASAESARRALAEAEARLRLSLAAVDVSVYEIDLAGDRVWFDHRATTLSRGLLPSDTWLSRSDPRWCEWLERIHPDDREQRQTQLRAILDGTAESFAFTYRFRDPDNVWRWLVHRGAVVAHVPGTGGPLRIVAVARDATEQYDRAAALERKVAERTVALEERERRYRGIFESAFQLTALLSRDGVVLELNRAALQFHGLTECEAIGRPAWEFGPWARSPRAVAAFKARLARAAAGEFVRYETCQPDASGRRLNFDFSLKPIFDEAGKVTLLVAEARDITDRAGLQAQLVQAQKMEVVGQLTGGVAHDFNNLLQALVGNLDLIRRLGESTGDERLQHLTANAQRAAARGTRLTRQLLAFSRRQQLRSERVDVCRLTGGMIELLRRAAGETVDLDLSVASDVWLCQIDPTQFETTLLNLVINARDAMPEGGTVRIVADKAELGAEEAHRLEVPPGDYVRVDVIDSGCGIAPQDLARLFEPFFTTKESGKGSGLGLAMVHGFARQSGGTVTVTSEPGCGTTFSLYLPRAAEPVAPEPTRPQAPPAVRAERHDVLVVEDDVEVREAMQFALSDAGYSVRTAGEADAALAVLMSDTPLDLLVCDVTLPGSMDGLEIAAIARRRRPDLRILLASGYGGEELHGAEGFDMLAKPFSQAELLLRVAQACARVAAG